MCHVGGLSRKPSKAKSFYLLRFPLSEVVKPLWKCLSPDLSRQRSNHRANPRRAQNTFFKSEEMGSLGACALHRNWAVWAVIAWGTGCLLNGFACDCHLSNKNQLQFTFCPPLHKELAKCCTDHVLTQPRLSFNICRVDLSLGENSDLPGVVSTRPSPGEEIQGVSGFLHFLVPESFGDF